jgi:DNA-binding transcriptional ArsR family regulator
VDRSLQLPSPDYEAADVLVVREPERLRALGHDLRAKIVFLLREQALSITELAADLDVPKGTLGHHVKVLEDAGLVRVVRTRRVRAVTEKFYGRTARLFLMKGEQDPAVSRLTEVDARRFAKRLARLLEDFRSADSEEGVRYELATELALTDDE